MSGYIRYMYYKYPYLSLVFILLSLLIMKSSLLIVIKSNLLTFFCMLNAFGIP